MEKSMNDLSTSEEVEVNSDFEELVEAFNDFVENVVKKNAYSKEDEMKLIDKCIEMIEMEM